MPNLTPQFPNELPHPNPNDSYASLVNIDTNDLALCTSSEFRSLERSLMESMVQNPEQQTYVLHQDIYDVDQENLSANFDKVMMMSE
jgi:hypothetical protein